MVNFLAHALSHLLVPMFLFGMVGSALVVVLSVTHDLLEIFTPDDDPSESDL